MITKQTKWTVLPGLFICLLFNLALEPKNNTANVIRWVGFGLLVAAFIMLALLGRKKR